MRIPVHVQREMARLHFYDPAGSDRAIADTVNVSPSTVGDFRKRLRGTFLDWAALQPLDDDAWRNALGTHDRSIAIRKTAPDYQWVHTQMQRPDATLQQLWLEFREVHPDGVGLTQFSTGYTLLAVSGSFVTAPALYARLPYDPMEDFAPVSLMSRRTTMVVSNADRPYRSFKEYVAHARAHPGAVNVGTTGAGGSPHLNAAWLHQLLDARVTFVHYKGLWVATTDLLGGRIDLLLSDAKSVASHIKPGGKLRALAVGDAERNPHFADVPTAAEEGAAGYEYTTTFGFLAPAGVPAAIIDKLALDLQRVAKDPEVVEKLKTEGALMVGSSPAEFRTVLLKEIARYKKIVRDNNIKLEE